MTSIIKVNTIQKTDGTAFPVGKVLQVITATNTVERTTTSNSFVTASNTLTVKFDTASTSTSGWGTTNDQWEYVLDDWAAGNGSGDTIEIRGDGGLRVLTINGSVTKTQIGSSDTYYYAIPVSVTTGSMSTSAGYIVSPLYLQHQYNG